jgi:hypothetical protein
MESPSLIVYDGLLMGKIAGGLVPLGSDCTRKPETGLCSLTGLEVTLDRWLSKMHSLHLFFESSAALW